MEKLHGEEDNQGWTTVSRLKKNSTRSFTIFVANLPEHMQVDSFKGVFQRFGRVFQASIPNRRTKKFNSRFGFISYDNQFSAEEASRKFDGAWYEDHRLIVKPARFERPLSRAHVQKIQQQRPTSPEWNQLTNQNKPSYAEALKGGHQTKDFNIKVHAEEGSIEWLYRSAVVRARLPFADQSITDSFSTEDAGRIQVRAMGGKSYVLTFASREEMLNRLQNDETWFNSRFDDAKEWSLWKRDNPCTRAVWINCYGVPLNLWNFNTFKSIGSVWGETISVDESTLSSLSFISGKVLIVTSHFEVINTLVQLVCKGVEYNIRVVEEQVVNISPDYLDQGNSSEEEDDDSSDDMDRLAGRDKHQPVLGGQQATRPPSGHEQHSRAGFPAVEKQPSFRGELECQSKLSAEVQRQKEIEEFSNSNFSDVGLIIVPSLKQAVHKPFSPFNEPSPSISHLRSPIQILSKAHSSSTTHSQSGESSAHLLVHCSFSWRIWSEIVNWWGIQWVTPGSIQELLVWWFGQKKQHLGRFIWEALPLAILWAIWIARNEKVFNSKEPIWVDLVESIKIKVAFWAKHLLSLPDLSLHDFLFCLHGIKGYRARISI